MRIVRPRATGASPLKLLAAALGVLAACKVEAGCVPLAPSTGQSVVCIGSSSVPVAATPGATQVAVAVEPGAALTTSVTAIHVNDASTIQNSGTVSSSGSYDALAVGAGNEVTNDTTGIIRIVSGSGARGIGGNGNGNTAINDGLIVVDGSGGSRAMGITGNGNVHINNGVIQIGLSSAMNGGRAISFSGADGSISNAGQIVAGGLSGVVGMLVSGNNDTITNSGSVTTASAAGMGAEVQVGQGNAIINLGSIVVRGPGSAAVDVTAPAGLANLILNGSGALLQSSAGLAVVGLAGNETLINRGVIRGAVELGAGANSVTLYAGSLITGDLAVGTDPNATLFLDGTVDGVFANAVAGAVTATNLVKDGTATWTLDRPIQGATRVSVNAGTLILDAALPQAAAVVAPRAVLAGSGTVASLTNFGSVVPGSSATAFDSLAVTGNYAGTGRLVFDALLAGSGGAAARLVVAGSTSGARSSVFIHNLGGAGGITSGNGIELIGVGGTSDSNAFAMQPLQVGPYVYLLEHGGLGASRDDGDWYLRSLAGRVVSLGGGAFSVAPDATPEATAALAEAAFAGSAFTLSLYDRLGNEQPAGDDATPGMRPFGAWARLTGATLAWGESGTPRTSASAFSAHFGADLWQATFGETASVRAGVMGAYASTSGWATGAFDPAAASLSGAGGAAGAYATWFENSRIDRGAYVDAWFLGGALTSRVSAGAARPDHTAGLAQASFEVGDSLALAGGGVLVTPQAQMVVGRHGQLDFNDPSGATVWKAGTALATRIGLRIAGSVGATGRSFAPFATLDTWHDVRGATVTEGGTTFNSTLPRQRYALQSGIDWRLAPDAVFSVAARVETAADAYRSVGGQLAFKLAL